MNKLLLISFIRPGRTDNRKGRGLLNFVFLAMLILITMVNIEVFADGEKYPVYFSAEQKIHQQMKARGHDSSYVSIHNNELIIKFEATGMDSNLPMEMIEILSLGYNFFDKAKKIIVEAFYEEKPLYRITANASDVMEFIQNNIEVDTLLDRMELSDTRNREELIKASFLPLDVHVHDVDIGFKVMEINTSYMGTDKQGMLEDYISMVYLSVQNAPWIEKVIVRFSFEQGMGEVTFSAATNDLLNLLEGNMTEEEYFNKVKTEIKAYEPPAGWIGVLLKTINSIKNLPYGNTILLIVLALLLFFAFRIVFKTIRGIRRRRQKKTVETRSSLTKT